MPCPDCVNVSLNRRRPFATDEIRQAVESTLLADARLSKNAAGDQAPEHGGYQSHSDVLTLQPRDLRRTDRPVLASLPPSPKTDSEFLVPRPYLMTSKAAWTALDFAIAFCCGSMAAFPLQGHLLILLAIIEAGLFACCVAALTRIFQLHPFECVQTVTSELLLIILSVSLAANGVDGLLRSLVSSTAASLLLEVLLTSSALVLCRVLWRRRSEANFRRDIAGRNILIVGADPIGRDVKDYLASLRHMGFRFKGFIALKEDSDNTSIGDSEIVGDIDNVISLAKSMFVDEIIFTHRPTTTNILSEVLAQARTVGIDVRLIPSLTETLKSRADVESLGNLPTIVLHRHKRRAVSNFVKRVIDVVLGSVGLVLASPLFLIIAALIKLQSPGPVFYKSKRVGYKGTTFYCYKFRSMNQNADSVRDQLAHLNERHDILFKIAKDPRVTTVGAFLRKYSIDELPQLWNVLIGDMSLVGPRPSIRSEVAQYKTAHLRRLDVIPGMTGLWQVEARQDPSFESYVKLDSRYVKDWSIWLDFKILARTFGAVLRGTGT